ncbi:MAG: cobalamin-binding protein, partial [Candidatus Methanomethylicota archaeon]
SYPLAVVDDFNRTIAIAEEPKRIVSLAPSNTEILYAIGAGDKLIGVTRYCDYPQEVIERKNTGDLAVVGGFSDVNIELIVSLKPDLVIAFGTLQVNVVKALEGHGIPVIALNPQDIEGVLKDIELVGKAVGLYKEAKQLVANLSSRIDLVQNKVASAPKVKVYYELWYDPLMSVGPGTFIHDLITIAGGENIFHDAKTQYPIISAEEVISRNPDVIILPDSYMAEYNITVDQVKNRPGWSAINAVKNDKIYFIDEDLLVRPGPRLVDGLEQLAKIIHPELFGAS